MAKPLILIACTLGAIALIIWAASRRADRIIEQYFGKEDNGD